MTLEDLWAIIYENDSVTLDVRKSYAANLKRKLSRFKYKKVQEIGDDPGRLKTVEIEVAAEGAAPIPKGHIRLRFYIEDGNVGTDLPIKLVQATPPPIDSSAWEEEEDL